MRSLKHRKRQVFKRLVTAEHHLGKAPRSDVSFVLCPAIGVSTNCCSETYGGTAALSSPEAASVTRYLEQRKADVLLFLTIHSYGQLILVPYGNPNLTAPNYGQLVTMTTTDCNYDYDRLVTMATPTSPPRTTMNL